MKKVKLCPAPHVEVCVHVTAGMEKDLRECQQMEPLPEEGWKDCGQCSWNGVAWLDTGFCDLPGVREAVLAEAAWMAIEELAAEGWIPVEKQLPGNSEIILVTRKCRNGKMYVGQDEYYDDTGFESGADEDIIAWMPLPEPYKPEN